MGFKRTADGRVFFQGPDNDAPENQGQKPANQQGQASTQLQIVALLKALNTKLGQTQEERNALKNELESYRRIIAGLEERTEKSEEAYQALEKLLLEESKTGTKSAEKTAEDLAKLAKESQKALEETKKQLSAFDKRTQDTQDKLKTYDGLKPLIEKRKEAESEILARQAALEALQKDYESKLSEQLGALETLQKQIESNEGQSKALEERIDKVFKEQEKLDSRIEKAVQDRTRLLRKIERIEETVLETRDALNSRAMVLLTDQNVTPDGTMSKISPSLQPSAVKLAEREASGEQSDEIIAQRQKRRTITARQAIIMLTIVSAAVLAGWGASELQKPDFQSYLEQVSQISPPTEQPEKDARPPEQSAKLDVNNPEQLRKEMDKNPDAVAAALNNIEPGKDEKQTQSAEELLDARAEETARNDVPDYMAQSGVPFAGDKTQEAAPAQNSKAREQANTDRPEIAEASAEQLVQDGDEKVAPLQDSDITAAPDSATSQAAPPQAQAPAPQDDSPSALSRLIERPADFPPLSERAIKDPNLPEVIQGIEKQAIAGVPAAQHDLGAIYAAGHADVKQDYKKAAFWFEEAARGNIANAAYNLGVLYHQGLGVKQDLPEAMAWYEYAAKLGHPEANYNLGIAYIEGIGVPYDPKKAAKHFELAANNKVIEAAYNLGLIYENGLLGKAEPEKALMWYKQAADHGSPEAREALDQLAKTIGITSAEVDRIAESMKAANGMAQAEPAQTQPSAASDNKSSDGAIDQTVLEVQNLLHQMGLYDGAPDGHYGPSTRAAILNYQSYYNLPADGQVSKDLLDHIRKSEIDVRTQIMKSRGDL